MDLLCQHQQSCDDMSVRLQDYRPMRQLHTLFQIPTAEHLYLPQMLMHSAMLRQHIRLPMLHLKQIDLRLMPLLFFLRLRLFEVHLLQS